MAESVIKKEPLIVPTSGTNIYTSTIDSYIETGEYLAYFQSGLPLTGWGVLKVNKAWIGTNTIRQTIITNNGIATRFKESTTWTSWNKVNFSVVT